MRRLAWFLILAGCGADDVGTGTDAATIAVCDPSATAPPAADGDGTPPVGTFTVEWSCAGDCDGPPIVIARANSVSITMTTRDNGTREGHATWLVAGEPLYPVLLFEQDGCWFRQPAFGGCESAWSLCDSIGRSNIAHLAIRDPGTGAEQIWSMR